MKTVILGYRTPNLGDDMQAISAAAHLPWIDGIAHRDRLDAARLDGAHLALMASWFLVKNYDRLPVPELKPLFYGFCLGRDELLRGPWAEYLRAHQPIGCRDTRSREKLSEIGVDAFVSGCITLFLGRTLRAVPDEERSGVVFVDVPEPARALVPQNLRDMAEELSNDATREDIPDPLRRMARMARICDRLRRAKLVVTRRLHTALPCVGFGTPVVAIVDGSPKNRGRFSGYSDFLPVIFHDNGVRDPACAVPDWDSRRPARPTPELEARYAEMRAELARRLGPFEPPCDAQLHRTFRLEAAAPEGFEGAREVEIDLGMARARRPVVERFQRGGRKWLAVEVEAAAPMARLRAPVDALTRFRLRRARLGRFDELVAP